MNRRPSIARSALGVVSGLALMASPLVLTPARADSSHFLSFSLQAVADGITMTGGSPNSAAYPQLQGRTPHTEARLETGPRGHALSSATWPGPLVAGAGSLAVLLGAPEEASQANYPVRSEAQSPAGPHEAETSPGFRAHAEGDLAEAWGEAEGMGNPDGFSAGSVSTYSRSEVVGTDGHAEATSESNDISFAGGQVTIESVVTVATARTNGVSGSTDGRTVVSGLVVGGQPARVDEDGVHFGDQHNPSPADAVADQVGEQVLSNFGIEMYVTEPQTSSQGGSHSYRSGSLIVVWDVFGQGQGIGVWQIGGSEVTVRGEPASPPAPVATVAPLPPLAPRVGGVSTGPPVTRPAASPAPPPSAPEADPAPAPDPVVELEPSPISADFFDGIPFLLLLAALGGSVLAGRSIGRLRESMLAASGACPLDDGR